MYAIHADAAGWGVMLHGNLFLQYLDEGGARGSHQTGSINWGMAMAQRQLGAGRLSLRGMLSAEPWTIDGCGYPNLLATGELCGREAIHDRQHPHDLVMELAAQYDRPLARGLRLQLYGGPAGEPALGPVAFMHRVSGMPNPLAPMSHHWFDATHVTFGVATAGIYSTRWKGEASLFNGREPDEDRADLDLAAMDSWSGRVWFLPSSRWALQVSGGRLNEAEPGHDGEPPVDVTRITASATYHRTTLEDTMWATTVGWGQNREEGSATNALLAETGLTFRDRDAFYGRAEWAEKTEHDLGLGPTEVGPHEGVGPHGVSKVQGGYTRYLGAWKGWTPGIGATVSASIVPEALEAAYGGRVNGGFGVYVTLRPSRVP